MDQVDVVIIGAGAAGMFCALQAARRARRVMVIDHNTAPGEKIRISGGGRCNFTNLHIDPAAYLSENPKFALSALKRFSQWDFIDYINKAGILWHEKTLGQLFCDGSAKQIVSLLTGDMAQGGVGLKLGATVSAITQTGDGFTIDLNGSKIRTTSLVIATGGRSIPKMGASGFAYQVARQFGLPLVDTRPGLVPLTFAPDDLAWLAPLAGLSVDAVVTCGSTQFREGLLFTHRGLSGPSILQISSYWREGQGIVVNMLPDINALDHLRAAKAARGAAGVATAWAGLLPKRLAAHAALAAPQGKNLADLTETELTIAANAVSALNLTPNGSEGYRTAEVTLGGISTAALDARNMQVKSTPGLYFIGEAVDVTGWLGGYNFQWAWSSGWAAGQVV